METRKLPKQCEDGPEKGTLKLIYSGAADTVLAGSGGPTLHELLE